MSRWLACLLLIACFVLPVAAQSTLPGTPAPAPAAAAPNPADSIDWQAWLRACIPVLVAAIGAYIWINGRLTRMETKMEHVATAEALAGLREVIERRFSDLGMSVVKETSNLRADFKADISNLRWDLTKEITNLRSDFKEETGNLRTDLKEEICKEASTLGKQIAEVHHELKLDVATHTHGSRA